MKYEDLDSDTRDIIDLMVKNTGKTKYQEPNTKYQKPRTKNNKPLTTNN